MISAVILTKNEGKNIKECIDSLKWCDEVIIIDDNSEDKTADLANKEGVRVYKRKLEDDFSAQRNFALEKAKGDWVLFIDADERVTKNLEEEIKKAIQNNDFSGYLLKRRDVMWGRELRHGETGKVRLLRLARKGSGRWRRAVHEVWGVQGNTEELKNPLLHYPHQTLREFISDIDWMSTLHAQENKREGKKSSLLKIIFYPKFKLFDNWILKLGFLDGVQGLLVALLMSFHSYLAWSKLWLMQRSKGK